MENIPFESPPIVKAPGSPSQSSLSFFLSEYSKGLKPKERTARCWEITKKWNSSYESPIDERELKDFFDNVLEEIREGLGENAETQILSEFIKEKTKSTYNLAKYLTEKYEIVTVGEKEREMYVYQNGYYFRAENEIIFPEIQRILGEHTTKNAKNETIHKIADMTSYPRSVFTSAHVNLIPLKNGVYDLETNELLCHSPLYRFTYQFPLIYAPQATCLKTEAFMKDILNDDQIKVVEEWLGYYFYRLYLFKKAIIFVGEGDTGKTTLLEVILNFIGRENVSAISLHKMTSDKFAAAHLYWKHGNIVDELSAKDISDTGNFKMATGGGSITGEYKFGNQFSFQNFSKFTFACNKIPDVEDFDDEAYFNRWMVIRFEKTITNKVPNFINTLVSETEMSGLFNLAMNGLRRLLANKAFSHTKTAAETKLDMMRSGSSMASFAVGVLSQEVGSEISKEDMYERYVQFSSEKGLAAETKDGFGKKFLFYVPYATDGFIYDRETGTTKRTRGWRNIAVKPTEEDIAKNKEFNEV